MIRFCVCVVVLGGTIGFLSCAATKDNPQDGGIDSHTDGSGPGGKPGGHGGSGPGGRDGSGPLGGQFGHGDGSGPIFGSGGAGGAAQPCDGTRYFVQKGLCAATYAAQMNKSVSGNCDYVTVYTGACHGYQVWATEYKALGDPVACAYDSTGKLAGGRTCTDMPMPAWNCSGAAMAPNCLVAGVPPDRASCALTTTCGAGGGHGAGGYGATDGSGPIGGRSGT